MDTPSTNTILIVDDDTVNLLAAKKLLQATYKTVPVGSAKQALNYLASHRPDLILLDVMMPEMDGFELMQILQDSPEWHSIPVIFLTADRSVETEVKCLEAGAKDFIIKPFVGILLHSRIKHALALAKYENTLKERAVELSKRNLSLHDKVLHMQDDIITSIANLIESQDGTTGGHIKRTRIYVNYLVQKMLQLGMYKKELTPRFVELISQAAPLHDIGKIAVPTNILTKPGRFTPEEYEIMKTHAAKGGELILKNMHTLAEQDFVQMAYTLANFHHERWNGKGYPTGRTGYDIPLAARIMAVADVFDALTSKRSYKDIFPMEKTLAIMREGKGTDFEPELIDAFLADIEELKDIAATANAKYGG